MPRNQQMGQRIGPVDTVDWTRLRRPGPCTAPESWHRASGQSPGQRATTKITYFAAGQMGWRSPEHRRTPNPRAADSVRSGKVDDPTPKKERFRRSEACTGGAGGTRTHGRRMTSPLRILAAFADHCRFTAFLQVRRADQGQSCAVLGGLFLSLWPLNGPWGPMSWTLTTAAAASALFSRRAGTLRAAESLTDAMMLHPRPPGWSIIPDVTRRSRPPDCASTWVAARRSGQPRR